MNCWAMRTSRNSEKHRTFVDSELQSGRLRQGWGWDQVQDLRCLEELWAKGHELLDCQEQAGKHWRMGNGRGDDYMQVGDLVTVLNVPRDGLFTLCRITGDYYFDIPQIKDLGHVRPVEVLTPKGVSSHHSLVHAALRRSFRCRLRLWNIGSHRDSLDSILKSGLAPEELVIGSTPTERVDRVTEELVRGSRDRLAEGLEGALTQSVRAEEWEPVLQKALEPLFPVSVVHTGGPQERGADLEIVIPNPFEENRNWIVAVQIKDHEGKVGAEVAEQLKKAFESRSRDGQVIAVVLLVSNADESEGLRKRMDELVREFRVPFIFCGRTLFLRILARGLLRQS